MICALFEISGVWERFGIRPDQIFLKEVYLATGEVREYESKSLDLEGTQKYVTIAPMALDRTLLAGHPLL